MLNKISGIKQNFDLLIFCLIIKKLQKLVTKFEAGDKDRLDPTELCNFEKFQTILKKYEVNNMFNSIRYFIFYMREVLKAYLF